VIADRQEQLFASSCQRGNDLPAADFANATRVPHIGFSFETRNPPALGDFIRSDILFEINLADRHLILTAMAGVGPELLERLAKEHAAALVLYARQWCGTPEDVVQEAIAAARAPVWFVDSDLAGLDAAATTAALRSLPPEQSEVIVARIWGGLTFEQIGEAVGCSAATAYRTYSAGLSALRKKLGAPCPDRPTTTN
jgi:DNA-directed RNA polymerase specialized sigma24 family protein